MIKVSLKIGFKFKTSLRSRRGSLINFHLISLRLGLIGCLTPSLKKEGALVHKLGNKLVQGVASNIMGIVLKGRTIVSIVEKLEIRSNIALMLSVSIEVVLKIKQVLLVNPQRRTASMISALWVRKRLLPTW